MPSPPQCRFAASNACHPALSMARECSRDGRWGQQAPVAVRGRGPRGNARGRCAEMPSQCVTIRPCGTRVFTRSHGMIQRLSQADLARHRAVRAYPEYGDFIAGLKLGEGGLVEVAEAGA